jgi:hypothetical protein
MGWTDIFPVFTEEMVDDFEALASPEDRAQLEEWYGTERVLNAQPDKPDIVSVSLFWKNVRVGDPELPAPTREILRNAQEMGLAKRFNPWDHYVKPLLEQVPAVQEKFPEVVVRVYLAKDMEFLAEELAAAGNEVHVMKSSSIHFAPGGLWRFLPFAEAGKRVTVTDVDRLNELESDLVRSRTMEQAGVGAWRVPVPNDLTEGRQVCYLPFMGCQFGVMGGVFDVRQLLDAFTWHALRGKIDPVVIYPSCGPLEIQSHQWPSYGFDEFFMTVAAYPRLAQSGMLTFVPTFAKSQLLTLDIEYVTWGNPNSELVYFPVEQCCGVTREAPPEAEGAADDNPLSVVEFPTGQSPIEEPVHELVHLPVHEPVHDEAPREPVVAFLFLSRGELNHPQIWEEYLPSTPGRHRIVAHTKARGFLQDDSLLHQHQIAEEIETEWGGLSLVRATLALLTAALEDPACTHFILVSESCVPVRPYEELLRSLRLDPRSRIRVQPWNEVRKWNILKAQRLENLPGIRKELAHFQDQWMCLNREDAELILARDKTESFEEVFAPDEAYFATVLAASGRPPLQAVANRPVTWTEWREGQSHPEEFQHVSGRTAAQIVDSGCFFARKFPKGSDIGRWKLHQPQAAKATTA